MAFQIQSFFLLPSFISCLSLCFAEYSVFTDIVSRVKALENEGTHQRQILKEQRTDLQMLQKVVRQQNRKLLYQTNLINDYMERVKVIEKKLAVLPKTQPESKEMNEDHHHTADTETQTGEKNAKHEIYDNEAAKPRKENIRQNRAVDTPVAFQAMFKTAGQNHIGLNQHIVFPDVVTNLGGGYHNQQGLFLAPRAGVYIFSTSILAAYDTFIDVDIKVNGNILASTMAVGNTAAHNGQGTVMALSQLAAGDEVWVSLRYPADASLQGKHFSTFMGCLVYPFHN